MLHSPQHKREYIERNLEKRIVQPPYTTKAFVNMPNETSQKQRSKSSLTTKVKTK